jgi:hypothetical protein
MRSRISSPTLPPPTMTAPVLGTLHIGSAESADRARGRKGKKGRTGGKAGRAGRESAAKTIGLC